jgi:hypothetical protein
LKRSRTKYQIAILTAAVVLLLVGSVVSSGIEVYTSTFKHSSKESNQSLFIQNPSANGRNGFSSSLPNATLNTLPPTSEQDNNTNAKIPSPLTNFASGRGDEGQNSTNSTNEQVSKLPSG